MFVFITNLNPYALIGHIKLLQALVSQNCGLMWAGCRLHRARWLQWAGCEHDWAWCRLDEEPAVSSFDPDLVSVERASFERAAGSTEWKSAKLINDLKDWTDTGTRPGWTDDVDVHSRTPYGISSANHLQRQTFYCTPY
jgi:hypothetical protein